LQQAALSKYLMVSRISGWNVVVMRRLVLLLTSGSMQTHNLSQQYPPTPTSYTSWDGNATSSQPRANSYVSATSSFSSNNTIDSLDEKYTHQLPALQTQLYSRPPQQQTLPPLFTKIALTPLTPSTNSGHSSVSSYRPRASTTNTSYAAYITPRGQQLPEYGRFNTYNTSGRYAESPTTMPSTSYMTSQHYQQQPQYQQHHPQYQQHQQIYPQRQQHSLSTLTQAATHAFSPPSAISPHTHHPSSTSHYSHNQSLSVSSINSHVEHTLTAYNTMHNHNNHTQLGYMPPSANVSYTRSTATPHSNQAQMYTSSSTDGMQADGYAWQYAPAPAQPAAGSGPTMAVVQQPVLSSSKARGRVLAAKMGRYGRECY
jgi:hypothetical protein